MIRIRGARQHNLRGLDLDLPKEKLIVMTGPSGSGKSSLAFHTLFAEGQRRFVESLSVYARQFLDQLEKPEVDSIEGLSPAIAIEQRSGGLNPRSTVATVTEIHEYLRVLWAAAGVPHDPETGERLERMTATDMVAALEGLAEGSRVVLLAPVPREEAVDPGPLVERLGRQGYVRVRVNGTILDLDEALSQWPDEALTVEVVIDRLAIRDGIGSRLADSVETALRICGSEARVLVQAPGGDAFEERSFQTSFRNPATGFVLGELSPRHFSFNSHLGACPACEGLGSERFCDPALLVDDESLPLARAVKGWWKAGARRGTAFAREAEAILGQFGLPPETSLAGLPPEARDLVFHGGRIDTGWRVGVEKRRQWKRFEGLCVEAERKFRQARSEAVKRRLSRVMAERPCGGCGGRRLKREILAVKIEGAGGWLGIQDFCALPVEEAIGWLSAVGSPAGREAVVSQLLAEVHQRLTFLAEVGLGYLALDRASGTLSGGEAQRIRLATQLGSGLTGVLYVLDEPSIGLHSEDTDRLVRALKDLRDRGNTVIVVEHDEAIIREADWLVELGPGAGRDGGSLLSNGPLAELGGDSPTRQWIDARRGLPEVPRDPGGLFDEALVVRGAREHNLRGIDVRIPLGGICCLTGPSGSGKSTLAGDILLPALRRRLGQTGPVPGAHDGIEGAERLGKVIEVDQSPIGRSPRSNPATFTGAFDLIRALFAKLPLSRQRGYGSGRFSFNTRGGRCERCEGAGRLRIEMHFLPDAWIECPACGGRRFNRETLEVAFKGLSIAEVLELRVEEALALFRAVPKLDALLRILTELGLGYLPLGQPSNTLSGGEAQRLKLALELARPPAEHTLYFFDEPTTGLHFGDVDRLVAAFRRLGEAGHGVLVVEHHLEVIAHADHVIDLGPEGGRRGGRVVGEGSPAELAGIAGSPTGRALARWLEGRKMGKNR